MTVMPIILMIYSICLQNYERLPDGDIDRPDELPKDWGGGNYIFAEVIKRNVWRCPGTTWTVTFDWSIMCSTSITKHET